MRVSTLLPKHRRESIEEQLERLRTYIEAKAWTLPEDHIFRDDGYSGASLNRPGLDRLRDKVRAAELDRVARHRSRSTGTQLRSSNGAARRDGAASAVRSSFSTTRWGATRMTNCGSLIRGAVAEYERTLIARRACAGAARGSCARVGCAPSPERLTAIVPTPIDRGTRPGCAWSQPKQRSSPSSLPVIASKA